MILLDRNNQPKNTVYYLSAVVYVYLRQNGNNVGLIDLYEKISNTVLKRKLNFEIFSLAIDFLFLIGKVNVNKKGDIYVYKKDKNHKGQE